MIDYLAIDPGLTTGFCLLYKDEFYGWQVPGISGAMRFLDHLHEHGFSTVIVEDFRVYNRALIGQPLWAAEIIGAVMWLQITCGGFKVVRQQPAQQSFYSDKKLRDVNLYAKGRPHINSAMKHLLYYLTFTEEIESIPDRYNLPERLRFVP